MVGGGGVLGTSGGRARRVNGEWWEGEEMLGYTPETANIETL